jgi:hypothetical protein
LSQITSQNNNIQEQMWQNELKLCWFSESCHRKLKLQ